MELICQYVILDETGEIALGEVGGFTLKDHGQASEFTTERRILMSETVLVPKTYENQYAILAKALAEYPGTFSRTNATAYDLL